MLVLNLRAGAAGLLLMAALAACTGGAAPSGVATLQSPGAGETVPSASPSASLDPEAARLEFARCMREHDVDLPDPGAGGGGPVQIGGNGADVEKIQEAMEACQQFLGDAIGERAEIDPEMQDRLLEFAECMRDNGVDVPDPDVSGNGGRIQIGGPGGIDPSSDEFQAAQDACQDILGDLGPRFEGGPGPGGGGTGPSTDESDSGVQVAP